LREAKWRVQERGVVVSWVCKEYEKTMEGNVV
jgi:hypothetical protein